MIISKKIGLFITVLSLSLAPLLVGALVNDITPTQVAPDAEPGWKGIISVIFKGVFNVNAYNFPTTSQDPGLEIISATIVSSTIIPPESEGGGEEPPTPPPTIYEVRMDLCVQTVLKLRPGKVGFTISDDSGNRVKGFIKVKQFSGTFVKANPSSVNADSTEKILLAMNTSIKSGSVLETVVSPSGCVVKSAEMPSPNTIGLQIDIPENAGGKQMSFWIRVGDSETNQTFVGINLVNVNYSSISILSVTPGKVQQGEKQVILNVKGKNIMPGTSIEFSDPGIAATTVTVLSGSELEATIDVSMKATPGLADVILKYKKLISVGRGMLTIIEAIKPVITRVEPDRIRPKPHSIFINIFGEGFNEGTNFTISGRDIKILGKNVLGPNQATLELLIGRGAQEGPRNMTVARPEGLKFNKMQAFFIEIPKPSVSALTPNYVEQGSTNDVIDAAGENFENGMTLNFVSPQIILRGLEVISPSSFKMTLDVDEKAALGDVTFHIANPEQQKIAITDKLRVIKKQFDYKISLLTPGVNCLEVSEGGLNISSRLKINTFYPVFKWFSNAKSFNFALFTAVEGQKELGEIITNRPYYAQEGLTVDNFTYPLKARELKAGKRYYWKVDAIFKDKTLSSEVWCFDVEETASIR